MPPGVYLRWDVDQLRRWIETEGRTHEWVGLELGRSSKIVTKACKRFGIRCARRGPRPGAGHPGWKGGRRLDKNGYVLVYVAGGHPHGRCRGQRFVLEHRLVMEQHLGRLLLPSEVVHHRDGDKQNNALSNLELFQTNGEHLAHELQGRVPQWTEEGKARIRAADRRRKDVRRREALQAADTPHPHNE